jgi:Tfp pilus assembly protein PilF
MSGGAMLSINFLKTLSVLTLGLFLTACASKKDSIEARQATLYFGAGTQSLMEKEYTEALKNLLKANELDPKNPEIMNNLGMAYYFKGEQDLAIRYLNEALKLDNKNSDARINLASIYFKDGKLENAEKLYKLVLKDLTYDKQARTYYNLGIIEVQGRKNLVAAEKYFKKSIKEDDNYCPAYHHLGLIQYNRRQFNSALRNFKEASMGTCYESPSPHYYQALSLIALRRYEDARIKLDEIDTRFKKSIYAVHARNKLIEINEIENKRSSESHASRKMLESPDF